MIYVYFSTNEFLMLKQKHLQSYSATICEAAIFIDKRNLTAAGRKLRILWIITLLLLLFYDGWNFSSYYFQDMISNGNRAIWTGHHYKAES